MTPFPERLAACLLRLYPRAFREAHGREVRQFVRAALETAPAARVAAQLIADGARSIPREWRAALLPDRQASLDPRSLPHGEPMRNLVRDARHALRLLRRTPGFTAAAVVTLALGIGANTAIFSLAKATLLRPVEVADPDRVVSFSWPSSFPDVQDYAGRQDVFSGVAAVATRERTGIAVDGVTELSGAAFVSGGTFEVLGVGAALGRVLRPSDDVLGQPIVGVLAHDYWRGRFGERADAVGRTIRINGTPVTIVGVVRRGFRGISLAANPKVFLPLTSISRVGTGFFAMPRLLTSRGAAWLTVYGRLQAGVTTEQATSAMDAHYRRQHPPAAGVTPERLRLVPLNTRALGDDAASLRRFVLLLGGVVVVTLLIGCANLANLLLARMAGRRREIGVRLALGASSGRVMRQMLAESLVLSTLGGVAGLVVARVAIRLLGAFELPGSIDIGALPLDIDRGVLGATAALSVATGMVFGAAPAWRASRANVLGCLGDGGRGASAQGTFRGALVAAQIALCLVLLAGGGLFVRSLVHALHAPLGYRPEEAAVASVNLALARFDAARTGEYYDRVLQRVKALPRVTAAAWATTIPTIGAMSMSVAPEGYPRGERDETFYVAQVGPAYFAAAGTRIVAGRGFGERDDAAAPLVAIVNETAARKYFGGAPLGRRLRTTAKGPVVTIVGVAEDTLVDRLGEPAWPLAYLPFDQPLDMRGLVDAAHLFIRASSDVEALLPMIASELRNADREAPVYDVRTFGEAIGGLVIAQRMGVTLLGCSSLLALALATVGIYGVASYSAALRTREIGIRIALGSNRRAIGRLILRQATRPIVTGILGGLALALWAGRLATAFLFGVSPHDPLTFGAVAAGLALVALLATWIPARRAARVDPIVALRIE